MPGYAIFNININNPAGKAIYAECVESAQLFELSKINL